jgi:RimJ/RimL family protein N-acetyltransferase
MPGQRMRFVVPQEDETWLDIKLAPLTDDSIITIADGLQDMQVSRFYGFEGVTPTAESLSKIYDDAVAWGIWHSAKLIGTTMFHGITEPAKMRRGWTATLIFDREYWGKGVATHVNKARTWYGFSILGMFRLSARVAQDNTASHRAIKNCGYYWTRIERNVGYENGEPWHYNEFECHNPYEFFWDRWWGSDNPPKEAVAARQRSLAAIRWAEDKINR